MLCEISEASGSFFATWAWLSVLGTFFLFITSAPVFYYYYWNTNVTFEKWIYKSNPKFPSPEKVSIAYFPVLNGTMTTTIFTGARWNSPDAEGHAVRHPLSRLVPGAGETWCKPSILWVGGQVCFVSCWYIPLLLDCLWFVWVFLPQAGPCGSQVLYSSENKP